MNRSESIARRLTGIRKSPNHSKRITMNTTRYEVKNKIRIVSAASLFDGHDASINIMRRILQASGAEVIHLGHNRSVKEIVDCAVQEDVQAVAVTSYQGGHIEYFKYMHDLLKEQGAGHIKIFGGGGGTILPSEIDELHTHGIARLYSPEDGRKMGLQGMINHLLEEADFIPKTSLSGDELSLIQQKNIPAIAQAISYVENFSGEAELLTKALKALADKKQTPVLGITGTGGAGKSSLTDELVRRFLSDFTDKSIAIISVDPSKRKTGGALLGDRIRMNSIYNPRVFMRSFATRQAHLALNKPIFEAVNVLKAAGYDLVIVETAGIGQSDSEITEIADVAIYVMTPEYGAATQLEKIDMIDYADLVALNKFDKHGALDALRDVQKQYQRGHGFFDQKPSDMPVYGTIASQFNDPGTNNFYRMVIDKLVEKMDIDWKSNYEITREMSEKIHIIPPDQTRYLADIADFCDRYSKYVARETGIATQAYQVQGAIEVLNEKGKDTSELEQIFSELDRQLAKSSKEILDGWAEKKQQYREEYFTYTVRGKEIKVENFSESLSHLQIPKISMPQYRDWGDILKWVMTENVPGEFPYTAGVYPFKRTTEDPTRMFAGEGGPERTNRRFHYLNSGMPAARLSTAFDSVTLYGEDPDHRPDIYGKVGNSGVNIATLDDAKKLYSGFDLSKPTTSVSMTINGPAPMILGFFMNAAIDQQCEIHIRENGLTAEVENKIKALYEKKQLPAPTYNGDLPNGNDGLGLMLLGVTGDQVLPEDVYQRIKKETLSVVRGTVQADILKEDQAQNTCIFSTEFALRMMGDIQSYFTENHVRNFYSVSISGYHIAEAGANPITQLALTLANGFTYVEYFLSRGLPIDSFAANLSFFFSNGLDPEYSVIGRVSRRIWAKAIRYKYDGNARSQMLKYHIQTSGRSLHAQEIQFNDIRTTLQALYAIYDNCNSLHTNAYDEAVTTPTEESVRRAVAIQLIINKEMGLAKNENPIQGSFIIEELTDLVEEAVLSEFRRITNRGGVLGAMETMYQRHKIQEESLYYESLKHSGQLPIIGVNTYLNSNGAHTSEVREVIRSSTDEKEFQINAVRAFQERNKAEAETALANLKSAAIRNRNVFNELMEVCKYASLGQISSALYEVGGQYRRNM